MTNQTIDAIYEHGVFRVLDGDEVNLPEGQQVRLIVEPISSPESGVDMLMHLYDGLSDEQIEEIDGIIRNRRDLFSGRSRA
jgi:predicted DNA-binding antitoxin AbrB/MazE fold protein